MKKLRDELESRKSNGEEYLIIKYVKGSPEIVSKESRPINRVSNTLNSFL